MYKLRSQSWFKRGIIDLYSCTILIYVNQKRTSHTIVSVLSVKNRLQRLQCNTYSKNTLDWDKYIVWLSLASRRLYNILYFLWLHNEFFIILYNILRIAELDCCQIIILSIYVPSTHAYTHVLRLSLYLPYETR
jgi:hypothetical protein